MRGAIAVSTCRALPCSWVGRLSIVELTFLPKLSFKIDPIAIGVPGGYFFFSLEIAKLIQKCFWRTSACFVVAKLWLEPFFCSYKLLSMDKIQNPKISGYLMTFGEYIKTERFWRLLFCCCCWKKGLTWLVFLFVLFLPYK